MDKRTITWSEFAGICKKSSVRFEDDDGCELVRGAPDCFGVELMNIDKPLAEPVYYPSSLNLEIDVEDNMIYLMTDLYATIVYVFNVVPYNFDNE